MKQCCPPTRYLDNDVSECGRSLRWGAPLVRLVGRGCQLGRYPSSVWYVCTCYGYALMKPCGRHASLLSKLGIDKESTPSPNSTKLAQYTSPADIIGKKMFE